MKSISAVYESTKLHILNKNIAAEQEKTYVRLRRYVHKISFCYCWAWSRRSCRRSAASGALLCAPLAPLRQVGAAKKTKKATQSFANANMCAFLTNKVLPRKALPCGAGCSSGKPLGFGNQRRGGAWLWRIGAAFVCVECKRVRLFDKQSAASQGFALRGGL